MAGDGTEPGRRSLLRRFTESLRPFSLREYRLLWVGQTVSAAGNALTRVAFVFAVLRIGGNAADIGYVTAVQTVSQVVFTLAGGVWADRMKRQFVMLTSDLLRAVVQALLAVLLLAGHLQVWELGIGASIFGAAQAFFAPASSGLLPEIVPAEQLQQANSMLGFANSFLSVGGPALSGVLVVVFGPGVVFAVDAGTFLVSALSLGMLRLPPRTLPKGSSFFADLATGWHEMAIRPWYWLNLIAHALWNAAIAAYFVLGPVIAERKLGGAAAWGTISACWAAGGVAGGIIALHLRPRRPLIVGNLALVLSVLPLLALIPPLMTWAIGIAAFMSGLGLLYLSSVWSTAMQQLIPDEVRSRVDSFDWLISLVVEPAGFAVVGPLAGRIGNAATLAGAALLIGVPCSLTVLIPGIRAVRTTQDGKIIGPPVRQPNPAPLAHADDS